MTPYDNIFKSFKQKDLSPMYNIMYPELHAYACHFLGDDYSFLAEDCIQNSIFNTFTNKDRFSSMVPWRSFLYKCIKNECINILRKGRSKQDYIKEQDIFSDGIDNLIIEQETISLLISAINSLPEKYKKILELNFEQGLKIAEIAQLLDLAEVTVKKQKGAAIEQLRRKLEVELILLIGLWI